MSTYLYLQKYRNTMYSKIKNYTTMFYEVYSSLGSNMYKSVSCLNGMYVIFIYLYSDFCLPSPGTVQTKSRVPLLFYFDVPGEDGGDFSLHESPWYVRADQGTFLSTGTVHFARGALLLYAFPRTREAELV